MDQHLAEKLVNEIGVALISDKRYDGREWSLLSLVATLGNGVREVSAYTFNDEGEPEPGTPRNWAIPGMFEKLRQAMQVPGQEPWKTCLFRVKRDSMRIRLDVEYDDPLRWKITPATMDRVLREIGSSSWPG